MQPGGVRIDGIVRGDPEGIDFVVGDLRDLGVVRGLQRVVGRGLGLSEQAVDLGVAVVREVLTEVRVPPGLTGRSEERRVGKECRL